MKLLLDNDVHIYKEHRYEAVLVYMSDVGLLRKHSHLATSAFAENNRLFTEFKGALTENFVLQSLSRQFETAPRYWTETPYEVDFVVQLDNDIIPVECKAGTNVRATSLKKYSQQYQEQTPIMVRFSLMNLSFDGKVLNIPLFLADKAVDLVRLALDRNA